MARQAFTDSYDNCLQKYGIQVVANKQIYLDEDTRLMLKVSKGDRDAYGELYSKYFFAVASFVVSLNCPSQPTEDITQEVFYRIWKKRKEYRPTAAFKTYLFGCARIVLLELLKSSKKDLTAHEIWFLRLSTIPSTVLSQSTTGIDNETISKLQEAKSQLTAKQFQTVKLFHDMHMSISKAARLTECTEKAFECRLARAHKKLRQIMISMETGKF